MFLAFKFWEGALTKKVEKHGWDDLGPAPSPAATGRLPPDLLPLAPTPQPWGHALPLTSVQSVLSLNSSFC